MFYIHIYYITGVEETFFFNFSHNFIHTSCYTCSPIILPKNLMFIRDTFNFIWRPKPFHSVFLLISPIHEY